MKIVASKDYVEKVLETYKSTTNIDYESGRLMLGENMPIIWARAEFMYNIYSELENLISESATSILRRIGKPYGSSFFKTLKESGTIEKLARNENVYLYLCSENLTIGWGMISIEEKEDEIEVISEPGLPVGRGFKEKGRKSEWPVDSYFCGYLEGFFSEMHRMALTGEEVECVGKGDPRCRMIFKVNENNSE